MRGILLLLVGLMACQSTPEETGKSSTIYQIAYISNVNGQSEIWLTDWEGKWVQPLTKTDSGAYAPSYLGHSGQLQYLTNGREGEEVYWLDTQQEGKQLWGLNPGFEEAPVWLPSGDSMIYPQLQSENIHLILADSTGEVVRQLTQGAHRNKQPSIGPDGKYLVFTSNRSGNQDIWRMELATGRLQNLTNHPALEGHPAWSGGRIVFYRYENGNADLYSILPSGQGLKQLTDTPTNELIGVLSPDGRYLAYGGIASDNWELFIANADGSEPKRLSFHPDFDGAPVWVPTWPNEQGRRPTLSDLSDQYDE